MPLGKIARLSHAIREQLNERLENHELSQPILEWLNALPEVQETLRALFDGRPISPQNLSLWRQGGFHEWQSRREALKQVPKILSEAGEAQAATGKPVADLMSQWGAAYYLLTARAMVGAGDTTSNLKMLRHFVRDSVALQRGGYRSGRLQLEHERLDFFQKRVAAEKVDLVTESLLALGAFSAQKPGQPQPPNSGPTQAESRLIQVKQGQTK